MNDWLEAVERLAENIVAGEVVFFVGAGYSLDSENNSAGVLIARLLARFDVLTEYMFAGGHRFRHQLRKVEHDQKEREFQSSVADLREGLRRTFRIENKTRQVGGVERFLTPEVIDAIVWRYYEINDWMCNAYSILLMMVKDLADVDHLSRFINQQERQWFSDFRIGDVQVRPSKIRDTEFRHILSLNDPDRQGKALFLDTMGFDDKSIMGGEAELPCEHMAYAEGTILPRHMVLAWMAREGLCPTLLTTNYDLLLEGACRRAGFKLNVPSEVATDRNIDAVCRDPHVDLLPPVRYQQCTRVARDVQYFNAGGAHQTALIYKIHGCVQTYRKTKNTAGDWKSYLDAMVFTFREIQNWRSDSWSRDLLYTLLRTRTIAFSGYSGQDAVIHDTFRTVYEDMARRRTPALTTVAETAAIADGNGTAAELRTRNAPAFFMDVEGKNEFHGLEILRSSSRAVGETLPRLSTHPNQLHFTLKHKPDDSHLNLDELQEWVFRTAMRKRQQELLHMHLWSAVQNLWQRSSLPHHMDEINRNFSRLLDCERESSRKPGNDGDPVPDRDSCLRMTPWLTDFHRLLMREFAIAETTQYSHPDDNSETRRTLEYTEQTLRESEWYFPLSDRPIWAAWAIVVEIAIRRMAAMLQWDEDRSRACRAWADSELVVPRRSTKGPPQLELRPHAEQHGRILLTISVEVEQKVRSRAWPLRRGYLREVRWTLSPAAIPWGSKEASNPDLTPGAKFLWDLARIPEGDLETQAGRKIKQIRQYLGLAKSGT